MSTSTSEMWTRGVDAGQRLCCAAGRSSAYLPPENEILLDGIRWGRIDCLFTPAYWAAQLWYHQDEVRSAPLRLDNSLIGEVVGCILGGYGTPSEVGLAAFEAIKASGQLANPDADVRNF